MPSFYPNTLSYCEECLLEACLAFKALFIQTTWQATFTSAK